MIIGVTAGTFDLCHAGHLLMFQECRAKCDHLIVGLQTDPTIDRAGKSKPIESVEERLIRLQACKYIDEVFVYTTEQELYAYLKDIRPDVRFLGMDHFGKDFTGSDLPIPITFNSRNHNFSSSALRNRIKNSIIKP